MSYYKGYMSQRGHGLGNVLGGILRAAIPIVGKTLKGVAKSTGRSLLRSGLQTLDRGPPGGGPPGGGPLGSHLFSKAINSIKRRRTRRTRRRRKTAKPTKTGRVQKGSGRRRRTVGHGRRRRRTGGYKRKRSKSVASLPSKKRRRGQRKRRRAVDIFS